MLRVLCATPALFLLAACPPSRPDPGTERGACYPNGTCNDGLVCLSDTCVRNSGAADAGPADGGSPADAGSRDSGAGDGGSGDGGRNDAGVGSCVRLLRPGALGNPLADACAAQWCCPEMDRCAADPACASCAAVGLQTCGANDNALQLRLCVRTQCLGETRSLCGDPGLGTASPDTNDCASLYCCSEFDQCAADQACRDCLVSSCTGNALADAFLACINTRCQPDICGTALVATGARNPYQCARCLNPTCCDDYVACVGASGPADVGACIACSEQPPGPVCTGAPPAVQQAAAAAQACLSSNCSAECEGPGAPAVVRTLSVELTLPQARLHGEVVSSGDSFLRERGACVGTSPAPTFCIPGNLPVVGTFATSIPTPALGAVYYARAYALTRAGKVYGQDIQFRAVFPGSPFEGGVVFHVDPDGMHGLIAAPVNQSTFSQWWDSVNHGPAMSTGATGTAVGTGAANTTAIVTALGAGNYAAKLCADLDLDGFSDWYLPSKDELNLMYVNRDAIGNLNEAGYWSSSEEVGTIVWIQNLGSGDVSTTESTMNNAVRAIRAF